MNPYEILGVSYDSDDDAIRNQYLDLVRRYPPEQNAERFAMIRSAYEQIKDLNSRVHYHLYLKGSTDTIDGIIQEARCPKKRPRFPLNMLLAMTSVKTA